MASSSAPAGPFPGVGANERRLYLVNHDQGITVYSGIDGSPDAIRDQDWTVALPAFQASHAPGSFTGLEIHCHGEPATVRLKPVVDRGNVRQFGEAVS